MSEPSSPDKTRNATQKRERPPVPIKPVKKKIGEARDNLRRREEWYQRRTGGQRRRST